jgi:hypothetical protein
MIRRLLNLRAKGPTRRILGRRLVVFSICVVTCLLVGSCSADRLVLGTDPGGTVDPAGATRRLVRRNGRAVECWVARSPGARPQPGQPVLEPRAFVLFFVGKGVRTEAWTAAVADAWGPRPVEVWGVNYPGYGGSDGPVRLAAVAPAALAAYDEIERVASGRPVFLQAASFGTVPALQVAAYAGPKRVIEMPSARHDDPLTSEAAAEMERALDWLWQQQPLPGGADLKR